MYLVRLRRCKEPQLLCVYNSWEEFMNLCNDILERLFKWFHKGIYYKQEVKKTIMYLGICVSKAYL